MEKLIQPGLKIALVILLAAPLGVGAATVDKDLEGIKKKIESEKRGISQVQKKEGSVLQLLGQMESELEKKNRQLKQANAKLESILDEMRKEEAESEKLRGSIGAKQQRLIERVVALYRWHRSGSPFVILNGSVSFGGLLQRARYLQTTVLFDSDLIEKLRQEAEAQEAGGIGRITDTIRRRAAS